MTESKVYGWLGLARKAGKLVAGDALCEDALSRRRVKLLLLATDAGANTRERFTELCEKLGVQLQTFGTKNELGNLLGRDSYAVIAILSRSFAEQIRQCTDSLQFLGENAHGGGTVE